MNRITRIVLSVLLLVGLLSPLALQQPAFAADQPEPGSGGRAAACSAVGNCSTGGSQLSSVIKTALNILSAIGAIIAIITVIIGGMRYITSGGDAANVSSAKNTILYALVGLLIIAFAQIIVQFVLERT